MLGDLEREQPAADWPWLRRWAEQQGGATLVFAAMDGGAVAVAMALRDPVRAEAPAAAEALVKATHRFTSPVARRGHWGFDLLRAC